MNEKEGVEALKGLSDEQLNQLTEKVENATIRMNKGSKFSLLKKPKMKIPSKRKKK